MCPVWFGSTARSPCLGADVALVLTLHAGENEIVLETSDGEIVVRLPDPGSAKKGHAAMMTRVVIDAPRSVVVGRRDRPPLATSGSVG